LGQGHSARGTGGCRWWDCLTAGHAHRKAVAAATAESIAGVYRAAATRAVRGGNRRRIRGQQRHGAIELTRQRIRRMYVRPGLITLARCFAVRGLASAEEFRTGPWPVVIVPLDDREACHASSPVPRRVCSRRRLVRLRLDESGGHTYCSRDYHLDLAARACGCITSGGGFLRAAEATAPPSPAGCRTLTCS
jgi:hypothetical protein